MLQRSSREASSLSIHPPRAILAIGVDDATGGAIVRRSAREGYFACVTRRNDYKLQPLVEQVVAQGGQAHAFGRDPRKEEMVALVERIGREIAPIEVAVFNIGAKVRFSIVETTSRVYFKVWEMACCSGFL